MRGIKKIILILFASLMLAGSVSAVNGSYGRFQIGTQEDMLEINEPLGDVNEILSDAELPYLLYSTQDYQQYIHLHQLNGKVIFDSNELDNLGHFLYYNTDDVIFTYELVFGGMNSTNATFEILGTEFQVVNTIVNGTHVILELHGPYEIIFEDGNYIDSTFWQAGTTVSNEVVEDSYIMIKGWMDGSTFMIDKILYNLTADAVLGDLYVAPGESIGYHLDEPEGMLTPNWDVFYEGFDEISSRVQLNSAAEDEYTLDFFEMMAYYYNIPFASNKNGFKYGNSQNEFWFQEGGWNGTNPSEYYVSINDTIHIEYGIPSNEGSDILVYTEINPANNSILFMHEQFDSYWVIYDPITLKGNLTLFHAPNYTVYVGPAPDYNLSIDLNGDGIIGDGTSDWRTEQGKSYGHVHGYGTLDFGFQEIPTAKPLDENYQPCAGDCNISLKLSTSMSYFDEPVEDEVFVADIFPRIGSIGMIFYNTSGTYWSGLIDPQNVSASKGMSGYGLLVDFYDPIDPNSAENLSISYPFVQRDPIVTIETFPSTTGYGNGSGGSVELRNSTLLNNSNLTAPNWSMSIAAGLEAPQSIEENVYMIPFYNNETILGLIANTDVRGESKIELVCKDYYNPESYAMIAMYDENGSDYGQLDTPAKSYCGYYDVYYYLNTLENTIEIIWEASPYEIEFNDQQPTVISTIHNYDDTLLLDGYFWENYENETGSSGWNKSYRLLFANEYGFCSNFYDPMECTENGCLWDVEMCIPAINKTEKPSLRNSTNSTGNVTFNTTKMVAAGLDVPSTVGRNKYELIKDNASSLLLLTSKNATNKELMGIVCHEGKDYWTILYHDWTGNHEHGILDNPGQTYCAGRELYYYADTGSGQIELVWGVDPAELDYDDQNPEIVSTIHLTDDQVIVDGYFHENYEKETASSGSEKSYRLRLQKKVLPRIRILKPTPLFTTDQNKTNLRGFVEDENQMITADDIEKIKIYLDGSSYATVYSGTVFDVNLTDIEYGEHIVEVTAETYGGELDKRSRMFIVDDKAPEIHTIFPKNGATVHEAFEAEFRVKDISPVECTVSDGERDLEYRRKRFGFDLDWTGPYTLNVECEQGELTSTAQINFTVNDTLESFKTSLQDYIDAHQAELNLLLQEQKNDFNKDLMEGMQFEQRINNILAELNAHEQTLANLNANNGTEANYTKLLNDIRESFGKAPIKVQMKKQMEFTPIVPGAKKLELLNKSNLIGKQQSAKIKTKVTHSSMEYMNGTSINTTVFTFTVAIGGKNYEVTIESPYVDYDNFNESMINIVVAKNGNKYELVVELDKNITGTNDLDLCDGNGTCNYATMNQSVFKVYVDNGVEFTIIDPDPIVKWSFSAPKKTVRASGGGGGGGSSTVPQQNVTVQSTPPATLPPMVTDSGTEPEPKKEKKTTKTEAQDNAEENSEPSLVNKITGGAIANMPATTRFIAIGVLLAILAVAYIVTQRLK